MAGEIGGKIRYGNPFNQNNNLLLNGLQTYTSYPIYGQLNIPIFVALDNYAGPGTSVPTSWLRIQNGLGATSVTVDGPGSSGSISFYTKNSNIGIFDVTATIAPSIVLYNAAASQFTALKAATTQATSVTFVLPAADASQYAVMQTNGSGVLSLGAVNLASSNAVTGTLPAANLPNPTSSTLGGIESYAAVSNQWINAISTSGVPSSTQPAFTNISGSVASTQLPSGTLFNFQSTLLTAATFSLASATFTTITGLSVSITPTSSSSKVLVRAVVSVGNNQTTQAVWFQLFNGTSAIGVGASTGSRISITSQPTSASSATQIANVVLEWVDSPATTSSITYSVQMACNGASTAWINRSITDTNSSTFARAVSIISATEIHA